MTDAHGVAQLTSIAQPHGMGECRSGGVDVAAVECEPCGRRVGGRARAVLRQIVGVDHVERCPPRPVRLPSQSPRSMCSTARAGSASASGAPTPRSASADVDALGVVEQRLLEVALHPPTRWRARRSAIVRERTPRRLQRRGEFGVRHHLVDAVPAQEARGARLGSTRTMAGPEATVTPCRCCSTRSSQWAACADWPVSAAIHPAMHGEGRVGRDGRRRRFGPARSRPRGVDRCSRR